MLTRVPGASACFDLGVVAYANSMKSALVSVPADVITIHGAVSEPVARGLAEGARARGGTEWGLGLTGVAGPSGGTPEKPVGTVHLAVAGPDGTRHWERHLFGDRDRVRKTAAYDVLNQLRLLVR
jgi:nicotinamide-nucleotide amidase